MFLKDLLLLLTFFPKELLCTFERDQGNLTLLEIL